ncbi:MAG: sugar ABC transporter ATP-binding protein [Sedimentisphaerales bacterium]
MSLQKQTNNQLLAMTGICKSFSGVQVLTDAQFDLNAGEVHILAGENGAGKSTLIKILAGVYPDYAGSVRIDSKLVKFASIHEAAAAGISVIHQELSLVGSMTVAENIFLGREKSRWQWLSKKAMSDKVRHLLTGMGLDVDVSRKVEDYPLSVQQMVEICKALAFDCRIIVMDEPTSALTEIEVEKLFSIVAKLKQNGCGIIYITHKMEEIYRIADRITVLRDGRYIGTAKASELNQPKLIQWMVGRELNQQFPRHRAAAGSVRLTVKDFSVADPAGKPVPAVSRVSFKVKAGEILGVAGLQGSGNSELLNGLFGTYGRKTTGSVELDGKPYSPAAPINAIEKGLSLLTNDRKVTGLVIGMNIVHNSTLAALNKYSPFGWLRPSQELKSAKEQSKSLNLRAASLTMPVSDLSGGNQQKVAIAKWIETQPGVFLLDEPTRGVDVGAKHEIYELMNKWTGQGIAIVLITSEMPELLAMSDRIIVMHRGRITAEFAAGEATQEKILRAAMG